MWWVIIILGILLFLLVCSGEVGGPGPKGPDNLPHDEK